MKDWACEEQEPLKGRGVPIGGLGGAERIDFFMDLGDAVIKILLFCLCGMYMWYCCSARDGVWCCKVLQVNMVYTAEEALCCTAGMNVLWEGLRWYLVMARVGLLPADMLMACS